MLENNSRWAKKMETERPGFFHELARTQHPDVLWIGCADSRVPSNSIVGLLPGEVFTHRNIANVVSHTDLSALSVLQYAVDVLKVKHIVVCGHYGCGGVLAAMTHNSYGLIDNWLRRIKDIYDHNREKIEALPEGKPREDFLIELNVAESISAIVNTTIVQKAWARGQPLDVHGWCYRLEDGRVRDLGLCISDTKEIHDIYKVFKQRDRPHDH
ncbi:carbonic anhydrase [Cladochytrium replicatum]|nr:carbonic anhydrase [Cladochytrium replicatum]